MSLPFQDNQVKERLLPILWRELLAKVEREVDPATVDHGLAEAIRELLPTRKISKKKLECLVANNGFTLETSTEVLNKVARCLGYGNWPGFVTEKRVEDQKAPKRNGPERDGGGFMFWGP